MADASLQAVLRDCLAQYGEDHRLSPRQWQVCRHLLDCRTKALGGFRLDCDHCGETRPPISLAATGIVRAASAGPPPPGVNGSRRRCCRCRITMWW